MANTFIYQAEWENKLAQRLNKPQTWKDTCDVVYTDSQTYNFPLVSASNEPAVATVTNTAAGRSNLANVIPFVSVTETNETLSVITYEADSVYIDYADQAQSNYAKQMAMSSLLGRKINERIETIVLANSTAWTDFGDTGGGVLGLAATPITVSPTNIDDIIRGVIEQIITANGYELYLERGGFAVWRPADWTLLVQFMQANGFRFADEALADGGNGRMGKEAMGLYHYVSTSHATGHVMAGVRGVQKLGILKATFGKIYSAEMPASSSADGSLSGTQIHTRVDYGMLVQTNLKPTLYDINVA